MNVIPAIDLKGGYCVRLFQGDFAQETRYSSDPAAVARRFAGMGFDALHLVDLDGARSGRQENRDRVRDIVAAGSLRVQLGGGIRDARRVRDWLRLGVRRVVIGSIAATDVPTARGWLEAFGAERIVLALDCRRDRDGVPRLTTHGWTRDAGMTLWDAVERYREAGLRHVLATDVARDGAMSGPALDLYRDFVARYPDLRLQASGGVRGLADLHALRRLGAAAAITGRALLDGRIGTGEIRSFLRDA